MPITSTGSIGVQTTPGSYSAGLRDIDWGDFYKDFAKERQERLEAQQKYTGLNVADWAEMSKEYRNFATPLVYEMQTRAVQQLADLQSGKLSTSLVEPIRQAAEAGQRQFYGMTGTRAGSLAAGAATQRASSYTGSLIAAQRRAELLDTIHRGLTARSAIL